MPLDAQDKVWLERLEGLLDKAAARAGTTSAQQALRRGGAQFAKAALEVSSDAEWRTQIMILLRQLALLLASAPAPDREAAVAAPQAEPTD
ncbi:MAG TPA: hypothetical protein VH157_07125 [Bryobacteraceae bacterium]|jgi:hypothetical protein|nr:hypothetical protein [Bryobacteraceae bacterium]